MPRRACPLLPQQARPRARRLRRGCAPAPHRPSVASARRAQETRLAAPGPKAPRTTPNHPEVPRAPAPAAASHIQPTATRPAPSPSLPRIYPRIYIPLPDRFGCPAARARSCRSRRSRPLALRRGQEGSAPSPAEKAQLTPTFSAAPTSAQPPFSSRSRSPWHTAPRRWCGCHGRDTAAGRARFGRGRIRSG